LSHEIFILHDTRGLASLAEIEFIDEEQSRVSLTGDRGGAASDVVRWALARSACLNIDDELIPLATADPELFHSFEVLSQQKHDVHSSSSLEFAGTAA
jgi:hypothetical protein